MGGLGDGGGELPSLTPQWMRAGAGGGRGAALTGGASAGGGGGSLRDAVPQLPPQLIRSGSAERMNGSGSHLGPGGGGGGSSRGNRRHRDHGGRSGRHHGLAQQPQQPHHHPVLNVELNMVPATLAPAAPVPASPKPPRSGNGVPAPEPFPRRGSGGSAAGGPGISGTGGGGSGDHGSTLGNGGSGGGGGSPADAADTWGHVSHTTSAGGYSNFDRGRGGGAAAAGATTGKAKSCCVTGASRSGGGSGRGRHGGALPVSPRRAPKGSSQHRSRGAAAKLGTSSWGEFDEEERPRPPRLRTASFSPRAGGGDRSAGGGGDRVSGADPLGGASLRSALLSPTRRSWRSSGSSDAVWTSRLAETANGRGGQPGSARQADMRQGGPADLGRSHSLPSGGRGGSPRAVRAGGSGASDAGSAAASPTAATVAADTEAAATAAPVSATQDDMADASTASISTAGDGTGSPAADTAAPATDAAAAAIPAATALPNDPLPARPSAAVLANGTAADLLMGLSLRPGQLRSGGAPKPYSPAKRAFGGGGGCGNVAAPTQAAESTASQPSTLAAPSLGSGGSVGGDSPKAAAAVMEVAQEVKEDAAAADAAELLPASSGDLLPAAEEAFLRSLGWTDCTEDSSPGLSDLEIAAFRAQQHGGASVRR